MRPIKFSPKEILKPFYREKVLTKEQLLQILGCSAMTAWRILSVHGYISAITDKEWTHFEGLDGPTPKLHVFDYNQLVPPEKGRPTQIFYLFFPLSARWF